VIVAQTTMNPAMTNHSAVDFTDPIDAGNGMRIGRAWIELRRGAWASSLRDYVYGDQDPLEQGQMDALDLLARRERTMRGLADRLRIDPSSATRAVQRLVGDGLAERFTSPDDGRVVMVRITRDGRARHADVASRRAHAMALILGEFDQEERADLAGLLERFVAALDEVCVRLARAASDTD
jgi:DNA-binding MarR family transcriptional regulator